MLAAHRYDCRPVGASLMVGGDTYDSGEEGEADRNSLFVPLNASDRASRRDECGAWPITGSSARSTFGETDKRKARRLFNAGRRAARVEYTLLIGLITVTVLGTVIAAVSWANGSWVNFLSSLGA